MLGEQMNSINVYLVKDELWLIHDCIPVNAEIDSGPVGQSVLMKMEDGILLCEDGDEKGAFIELTREELVLINGCIPSGASNHAKPMLVKTFRALWQIRNQIMVADTPDNTEARSRLEVWRKENVKPQRSKSEQQAAVKNGKRATGRSPRPIHPSGESKDKP